jgi:hypothetical protein
MLARSASIRFTTLSGAGFITAAIGRPFCFLASSSANEQSALNQREYCEAQGIPLKAFGNWRAKFKAEPHSPPQAGSST